MLPGPVIIKFANGLVSSPVVAITIASLLFTLARPAELGRAGSEAATGFDSDEGGGSDEEGPWFHEPNFGLAAGPSSLKVTDEQ